jgi:RNAse (barnase) inhibitor barstar
MTHWIDVRAAVPWLSATVPMLVSTSAEGLLRDQLEKAGFDVAILEGNAITNEAAFFANVAHALKFPAYFGHNWDAFHDSFAEIRRTRDRPLVLIWRDATTLLANSWPTLFRATHEILSAASASPEGGAVCQVELILLGADHRFARPSEAASKSESAQ